MSLLSKLKLSEKSPREELSPVARKRRKLLEHLETQSIAAQLEIDGKEYLHSVRRWVHVDGQDEKQLVIKQVPVRRWWWTDDVGKTMLSLRQGNRLMEIANGKTSIEVGELADLPATLETLHDAIVAGELDEQLKKSPFVKPIVPKSKAKSD